MNPQELQAALVKELGLGSLPPQMQQEAIAAIGGPVFQSVTLDILEKIPQAQQDDFQKALESGDSVRVESIIAANIPDSSAFIEQSVAKAIAQFKALKG